jgi:hypothetical protein
MVVRAFLTVLDENRGLMMARGLAENGAKVYIGSRRIDVVENAAITFNKPNLRGSLVACVTSELGGKLFRRLI